MCNIYGFKLGLNVYISACSRMAPFIPETGSGALSGRGYISINGGNGRIASFLAIR